MSSEVHMAKVKFTWLEWFFVAASVICCSAWALYNFDPSQLQSLCGGLIPIDQVNIPLERLLCSVAGMVAGSLFAAPVVLVIRMSRKVLEQSVVFYFGEKLWYCESFIVIIYMITGATESTVSASLVSAILVLFFVPMFIIPIVATGYFLCIVCEEKFYKLRSINGFAIAVLVFGWILTAGMIARRI